jgi:hypothetical protein
MSSFSLWGGLGEPGEASVKCRGKEITLGAHAHTRNASPTSAGSKCTMCYTYSIQHMECYTLHCQAVNLSRYSNLYHV